MADYKEKTLPKFDDDWKDWLGPVPFEGAWVGRVPSTESLSSLYARKFEHSSPRITVDNPDLSIVFQSYSYITMSGEHRTALAAEARKDCILYKFFRWTKTGELAAAQKQMIDFLTDLRLEEVDQSQLAGGPICKWPKSTSRNVTP